MSDLRIVEVLDRWDDSAYYRVVTDDVREIEELNRLASEKGLNTRVRRADDFAAAKRFLDQM